MANTIGNGDLSYGGAVIETSSGTKYAIFYYYASPANDARLKIYKNIDGTPSEVASVTLTDIFGSLSHIQDCDAALDSAGDIHVVCIPGVDTTRDVAYRKFDTATDSWEGAGWEEAATYTDGAPTNAGCSISIDSNNYPHILYVDDVKYHGTNYDQIKHAWNDGSWNTELVCTVPNKNYSSPKITCCPNDDLEAFYECVTDSDPTYRRKNAGWGTESAYSETNAIVWGVVCTIGDTVYRYHTPSADVKENNVDTGYDATPGRTVCGMALADTTRYVFYPDADWDIHLIWNDGGGWTDEGDLQEGTYNNVIAEWAYNFEYQSGEINYIFDDGTNVYYDAFSLAAGLVKIMGSTVGLSEAALRRARSIRLMAEVEGIQDAIARKMRSIRQMIETISLQDTLLRRGALTKVMATETLGVSDSMLNRFWLIKIMSEAVGLVEGFVRRMWSSRFMAEAIGLSDASVRRMWSVRQMVEALSISEVLLRRGRQIRLTVETVSISETKLRVFGFVKLMAETVGISETMNRVAGFVKVMATETVAVSESVVRRMRSVRQMVESISLPESVVRRMWSIRQMASTVGISDALLRRARSVREMASTIGLSESLLRRARSVRLMVETVSISETFVRAMTLVKIMASTVNLSDSKVRRMWMARFMDSTMGIGETLLRRARMVRIINEVLGLIDSWIKKVGERLGWDEVELESRIHPIVGFDSPITPEIEKDSEIGPEIDLRSKIR